MLKHLLKVFFGRLVPIFEYSIIFIEFGTVVRLALQLFHVYKGV